MNFEIPILKNSFYNLSKFDFSAFSIRILNIESDEFREHIKNLNPEFEGGNFAFFNSIIDKVKTDKIDRYAIIKNNWKDFSKQEIYNVHILLLIIFPCGLQIDNIVHFMEENNFVQRAYMTNLENKYIHTDDYLSFDDDFLEEANEFINLVFNRINYNNYIGLSIENYLNSFNVSHLHFAYIALCMCLENLIVGSQELSYRLKRTASILCGSSENHSSTIFKNLNKIYQLRSKIVHGEVYTAEEIYIKIEYLKSFVSRLIIELLLHNIPTTKQLDPIITKLGFGQRDKITDSWQLYKINILTLYAIRSEIE